MNEFEDYYYGYMVPILVTLRKFALYLYDEGFVIQMPLRKEPDVIPDFKPAGKTVSGIKKQCTVGKSENIETVGALNDMVTKYDMREICTCCRKHIRIRQIAQIAAQIAARPETKLVMIAGPSSSGKTNVFSSIVHSASNAGDAAAPDCRWIITLWMRKNPER